VIDNQFVEAPDKFADKTRRASKWELWAKYVIRHRDDGKRYIVAVDLDDSELPPRVDLASALEKTGGVVSPGSPEEELARQAYKRMQLRKEGWVYYPLVEKPDLFLKFARLADDGGLDNAATADELDTDKNASVALDWAEEHGTLGLTRADEQRWFRGASTRGGIADTVASFAYDAWRANACLRLCEAATADEIDMDLIHSYMDPYQIARFARTPANAREWALNIVATETQRMIAGNAYPALYGEMGRFISGWSFSNLLGAMWLQMYWLLTATVEPSRCRNPECDKIIAYEQPDQSTQGVRKNDRSSGYATRKDKRFCGRKCRNRYRYLTTTKPRRQAARES
jgi:hypothetical protein